MENQIEVEQNIAMLHELASFIILSMECLWLVLKTDVSNGNLSLIYLEGTWTPITLSRSEQFARSLNNPIEAG